MAIINFGGAKLRNTVIVGIVILIALAMIGQAIAEDGRSGGSSLSPAGSGTIASVGGNVRTVMPEVSASGIGAGFGGPPEISSRAGGIFGRIGKVGNTGFGQGISNSLNGMWPSVTITFKPRRRF